MLSVQPFYLRRAELPRRRQLFSGQQIQEEVNISPLIDIVFILLIFFVVTAVFTRETGIKVERPKALSSTEVDTKAISIVIKEDGRVYSEGIEIGVRGVRPTVRRELLRKDRPVVVMVDRRTKVQLYAEVHDEALLAGANAVSMATQR
jgi:biopolymer transport protein ExbD